ncbi:MAG: hypothetical protein CMG74_13065 [Candidatus Marinimicrobia bacterium]|mgnify:CR=1 FL=1|nr:hypothetical protein [Candidatus Neomarinimicrobiota bacterium]|tara:strand:- start:758 stop:1402 length:645 start_codon:yes stop_codon:yes gene_type:complete
MNNNYLKDQGLDKLINNDKTNNSNRIKPKYDDLIRLHKLILKRKPKIILEFGVGWSTIVIADAINKTKENSILYSVDASKEWLKRTKKLIPKKLKKFIIFHQSDVHIDIINGQLCSLYDNLPDIVPDFIYLDGPDPKDIQGNINGLSFNCSRRTVMSGDIILMESTLLPDSFILVDGRTNNSRFLNRMFLRKWKMRWDRIGDITTFELIEDPLK